VTEERILLCTAAGAGFAFNLREICEVMEPQASFPVPGAPGHFMGVINCHGTLTALVDLGLYLGHGKHHPLGNVLVLDTRLAQLALMVDGVCAIVSSSAVTGWSPDDAPQTEALLESSYGTFRLLRLETLLFGLEQGVQKQ
jgi:purine-binding chemotaxis protein CheW